MSEVHQCQRCGHVDWGAATLVEQVVRGLLLHGPSTVNTMAGLMHRTNAVVWRAFQLAEAAGVIRSVGRLKGKTRPAQVYDLTELTRIALTRGMLGKAKRIR